MIREITVIDPQHPLRGERLALLSLSCSRGPNFIAIGLPDGRRRLIRRAATDIDQPVMTERSFSAFRSAPCCRWRVIFGAFWPPLRRRPLMLNPHNSVRDGGKVDHAHCRKKRPRPWPSMTLETQLQLAQQMARLLSRLRLEGARHADHAVGAGAWR